MEEKTRARFLVKAYEEDDRNTPGERLATNEDLLEDVIRLRCCCCRRSRLLLLLLPYTFVQGEESEENEERNREKRRSVATRVSLYVCVCVKQ